MIGLTPYTTLSQFLIYIILAGIIYQGVRVLRRLTWSTILSESNAIIVTKVFDNFLLIYEPLALLFLLSALIGVKPAMMLPIVLISLVISHKHWRNYISRTIVLINNKIKYGVHVHSKDIDGKVIKLGRLVLEIQTEKGIHIMSYQSLIVNGYTLSEGDKISRLYAIRMRHNVEHKDQESILIDHLANTPYIDWSTAPEIILSGMDKEDITLKVVLRDKTHLDEIVSLLHEWQYSDIVVNQ